LIILDLGPKARRPNRGLFDLRRAAAGLLGASVVCIATSAWAAASFDCVMDPTLTVKLGSPVTSVLSEVLVDRGDHVKKGLVIAKIESAAEQAQVAVNQARADSTAEIEGKKAIQDAKDATLRRKQDLRYSNPQEIDIAQAEATSAKADVLSAQVSHIMAQKELLRSQALLDQKIIRSPLDGVVVQRGLGPGEYVRPDNNIVTLASVDPLNVEAYLPVRYYGSIKIGDTAIVHPDDPVGGERQAKVSIVDQVFDAASGTFGVRLLLPNADNAIPGGLRCKVTFDVPDMTAHDADASDQGKK
jgi:RND family efflux transporter MFP subunit